MANSLLDSTASTTTTAPSYYTNYLSNIASAGAGQAGINSAGQYDPNLGAQFIGPQDLQNTAFNNVEKAANAYAPTLTSAGNTLTGVGTSASPLASAQPYLTSAQADPSAMASGYMNNAYMKSVIDSLRDAGQRNIQQNLAPSATSSAVGSGQYGSQRGAQVLGQVTNNANRDLENQIAQTLNTGYNTALTTAEQQNALQGQLGTTAANAASSGQQNMTQLGTAQSNLASNNQALNLADINALSTLGGQQQTIKQNQQNFPLTNLSTLSALLRGYNVPMSSASTQTASPLSTLGGAITGTAGLFTPTYDKNGNVTGTPASNLSTGLKTAYDTISGLFS